MQRALKSALKSGRWVIGSKEVVDSIRGSKVVVCSRHLSSKLMERIASACRNHEVPLVQFQGSSLELASVCAKQFPVSALAFRSIGDEELKALMEAGRS